LLKVRTRHTSGQGGPPSGGPPARRVSGPHGIADVPDPVPVRIGLVGVPGRRAIVAGVSHQVSVGIHLVDVGYARAVVVAQCADPAGTAVVGVLSVQVAVVQNTVLVEIVQVDA